MEVSFPIAQSNKQKQYFGFNAMKISLIESYQVQDVRHYELDKNKIEADFGSTENFQDTLFSSEWSEDTHFLNLLHKYGKEVNFKQNQQQWSDFTIQKGHIKTDGKGNKIRNDGTSEKL